MKKELKHLYNPPTKAPVEVEVEPAGFVMIDGRGDPNDSAEFQAAVEVLFGLSFTLKFISKKELDLDYVVMPLEGLWWVPDMARFDTARKDEWLWTLMIRQPEWLTEAHFERAIEQLKKKKDPPALNKARFEVYNEGLAAQIMHVGPFAEEGPTIEKLHEFIEKSGRRARGKHHEIYLSDFRRCAPERLRTVIRQPMA